DGLLDALERSKNEGLKPVYDAGAQHYRRALQIKRLMARGISGRDKLRIQLFLRGYGVKPWDVREAVRREYANHLRSAFAQVRSTYLDNTREIGPAHKSSLRKQLGSLDERLKAAGLEMSPDAYIELTREAKLPINDGHLLAGWLCIDPGSDRFSDRIENALSQPGAKFIEGREGFRPVDRAGYSRAMSTKNVNDPNCATIAFIQMLCCVQDGSAYNFNSLPQELEAFASRFRDILSL